VQEPEGSLLLDPKGIIYHNTGVRARQRRSIGRQARLNSGAIGNTVTFGRLLLGQTYGTKYLHSQRLINVVRRIGGYSNSH